jgi:hypothetical protein
VAGVSKGGGELLAASLDDDTSKTICNGAGNRMAMAPSSLTSRNAMNAPNKSFQIEVFESGIVVKHADGHWVSYARPAEAAARLPEQSCHRNAAADASFDRFRREAEVMAHHAALRLNWIEVDSAA